MKKLIFLLITGLLFSFTSISQTIDLNLGAKHNQVVEYLNNYNFTGKTQDNFMDDVIGYSAKLIDPSLSQNNFGGIFGKIVLCGKADPPTDPFKPMTYEDVLQSLERSGKISSASNSFLKRIISETENIADYNVFTAKISELETGYNTSILPEQERNILSGSLSIFKQSATYWNNYYSPEETTPNPQQNGSNNFLNKFKCFFCVAKNDLKGALLGFLIGNCICAKLGIPNPAICGAIGATIFGSLYSWAAKVCPDICSKCKKPSTNSYPSWICKLPFLYWP